MSTERAVEFARNATLRDAPDEAETQVKIRVLDTLAATTAGYRQEGVDIVRNYARERFAASDSARATLLDGTGTALSTEGATLANGIAANALDVDDGHREVKGHPAAVVVPPALAAAQAEGSTVAEFLDAVYVGYELAVRAGLAIHEIDQVYTGTGSWGALGAAATVARLHDFSPEQTADALGVAEYHAPRTPIMRGVEQPGMTKDGIGWGAYSGIVSAQLAEAGFSGSGTVFDEYEGEDTFGETHHVTNGYLKPYPCCRWAQPGVEAVLSLAGERIETGAVETIRVETFEEATHLHTRAPETPEEAQYSYPYPVAAALERGQFTQAEHSPEIRTDPDVLALAERVELVVSEELDERFPSECLARVTVEFDGETVTSEVTRPRGARDNRLSGAERLEKARRLVAPTLSESVVGTVEERLEDETASAERLLDPWRQ